MPRLISVPVGAESPSAPFLILVPGLAEVIQVDRRRIIYSASCTTSEQRSGANASLVKLPAAVLVPVNRSNIKTTAAASSHISNTTENTSYVDGNILGITSVTTEESTRSATEGDLKTNGGVDLS